ncbi:MAG: single-stranded DNA-binding protein [Marinilabiliales bacterium]|nr:MAG: single-stranded DNA-binding protein [Marinilabiliales bacterium]
MNTLRNKVQLIGNLGSNPEIKEIGENKMLAKLSLATTEVYNNNEGKYIKKTLWHSLVAWGNTAKIAEKLLKKGDEVAIEGKLVTRSYESNSGERRYITEVIVNDLLLLRNKQAAA